MPRWRARSRSRSRTCRSCSALDEALVFWLAGDKESYVFALTREGFEWKTIPLGAEALAQKVAAFRRGLDVDAVKRGLMRTDCTQAEADKRGLSRAACGEAVAKECEQAAERGLVRVECSPKPDEAANCSTSASRTSSMPRWSARSRR